MSISGLVLQVRPKDTEGLRRRLEDLDGVEVHAITDEGRMVVTVDQPEDGKATETLQILQTMEGILSTSLVYNHLEQDPA
jgi:periplasmic nitrate reductase NapD